MLPRAHASWEETGTFSDVIGIVQEADRLGYHHCTCSEHVAIPTDVAATRGARYWDPLATFGALSAHTTTIRFATHVLVLGYHHPLAIAKRYGTLDQVSAGRVILGVGVGSLEEEFDLLGAPFADRGDRADDAMRALRASLSQREPAGPYPRSPAAPRRPSAPPRAPAPAAHPRQGRPGSGPARRRAGRPPRAARARRRGPRCAPRAGARRVPSPPAPRGHGPAPP